MSSRAALPDELENLLHRHHQSCSSSNAVLLSQRSTDYINNNRIFSLSWNASTKYAPLRKAIILETDYPIKLLANPTDHKLHTLGRLAEAHEARQHLVQKLGIIAAIQQVVERNARAVAWSWVLYNHIFYVEEIPHTVISALVGRIQDNGNDMYAMDCLARISMRGTVSKHLLDPFVDTIASAGNGPDRLTRRARLLASVAHATESELLLSRLVWPNVLALPGEVRNEQMSRRHLSQTGYVRPGETLLMYLSLCSSKHTAICYIGAYNLTIVLCSVDFNNLQTFDSVTARLYAAEALQTRTQLDSAAAGKHICVEQQQQPHQCSLLVECVLRLTLHEYVPIRQLAWKCVEKMPANILETLVWSPSLHRFFDNDQVVMMLMICRRLGIPNDLCVTSILTFACQLKVQHVVGNVDPM